MTLISGGRCPCHLHVEFGSSQWSTGIVETLFLLLSENNRIGGRLFVLEYGVYSQIRKLGWWSILSEISLPVEVAALIFLGLYFTNMWSIDVAEVYVMQVGVLM